MVVCEDLEFGVEVEGEVNKPRESRRRVARGEGFQAVVDGGLVACADAAVVHDVCPTGAGLGSEGRHGGFANGEEVRAEAAYEALEDYLEDCGGYEGVEQAEDGVVDVPEGADAQLH